MPQQEHRTDAPSTPERKPEDHAPDQLTGVAGAPEQRATDRRGGHLIRRVVSGLPAAHPVDEVPPLGRLTVLGLQHVMVMYASAVAVPLVIGAALKLSPAEIGQLVGATLFFCGVGTLLQSIGVWKFGIRLPLVMGSAFNGVAPMILIGTRNGIPVMYGALIAAGLGMILLAPVFTRILRLFPPVVIGTAVTLIGLQLLPAGVSLITGPNAAAPDYANGKNLALGLGTLALVIVSYRLLPAVLKQSSVLIAMLVASLVGLVWGATSLTGLTTGQLIRLPDLFHFGTPSFELVPSLSLLVIMFVLMVEGTGQMIAVGEAVDKPVTDSDIARGLRADGLTTTLGGLFNTVVYTTFAQNIGIITLTKVRSRYVVSAAGIILILLGVFPPAGRVVAAIPQPVLGGAAIIMFAMVAVVGIRSLATVDYSETGNLIIVATSLAVGLIPSLAPSFYHVLPSDAQLFLKSGVAAGTITAVILNLIFVGIRQSTTTAEHQDLTVPGPQNREE